MYRNKDPLGLFTREASHAKRVSNELGENRVPSPDNQQQKNQPMLRVEDLYVQGTTQNVHPRRAGDQSNEWKSWSIVSDSRCQGRKLV